MIFDSSRTQAARAKVYHHNRPQQYFLPPFPATLKESQLPPSLLHQLPDF
jgi:hypothetical protein